MISVALVALFGLHLVVVWRYRRHRPSNRAYRAMFGAYKITVILFGPLLFFIALLGLIGSVG